MQKRCTVDLWTAGCAGSRLTAPARSPMDKPWATRRVAHRLPTGRRLPTSSTALNPIDIKSGKVKTKSPAPALAYSSPVTVQTTGTTAGLPQLQHRQLPAVANHWLPRTTIYSCIPPLPRERFSPRPTSRRLHFDAPMKKAPFGAFFSISDTNISLCWRKYHYSCHPTLLNIDIPGSECVTFDEISAWLDQFAH